MAVLVPCMALPAAAEVRLPQLISDHMVFQCGMPLRIWGWASEGEQVRVHMAGTRPRPRQTTREHGGSSLPPCLRAVPTSSWSRAKNRLVIRDVLVGEVWVGSGQSNMEWILAKSSGGDRDVRAANYPEIRLFNVPRRLAKQPESDVAAQWNPCSPQTVGYFSAVAFYFGREIHRELKVPVGLIASAYGGTRIEPWTPAVGVASVPELRGKDRPEDGELYNGMIRPLTPLRIRGVIWYQGEGNVGDGMLYAHRMRGPGPGLAGGLG